MGGPYRVKPAVVRKGEPAEQIFVVVSGRLEALTAGQGGMAGHLVDHDTHRWHHVHAPPPTASHASGFDPRILIA